VGPIGSAIGFCPARGLFVGVGQGNECHFGIVAPPFAMSELKQGIARVG